MNDSRAPHSHLIPSFRSIEEEAEFWDTHDTVDFEDEWELVTDVTLVRDDRRRLQDETGPEREVSYGAKLKSS